MTTADTTNGSGTRTRRRRGGSQRVSRWLRGWLARPLTSFHLVLGVFALLTGLGLVMVLSASSVEAAGDGSAYSLFRRQAVFVLLGLGLFYLALRIPLAVVRALSLPAMLGAVALLVLVLVPGIGQEMYGSRSWFDLKYVSFQPSEAAKVAFAVWGAHVLATHRAHLSPLRHLLVPLVPAASIVVALILLQPDLGTTITLAVIVLALLWFGGIPMRLFAVLSGVSVAGALAFALTVGPRSARIEDFLNPERDPAGGGYQALQAKYSLADGGWWGVGLGQSRAKWNYLPNAQNDFIFAILGEELGFLGGVVVLAIFAVLALTGLRISARSVDPFLRLLSATFTVWLVGQAFFNIGYVVGLLPVTGLQLPLVSSGGTSTAITMFVFGLLANAARHEPQAVAALRSGDEGRLSKMLRLPAPAPWVPRRVGRVVRPPAEAPARRATSVGSARVAAQRSRPGARPARPGQGGTRGRGERR